MWKKAEKALGSFVASSQIEALCPGVSRETVRKVLNRLKSKRKVKCIRRGPDAEWTKLG